jgi:hypothetical protein
MEFRLVYRVEVVLFLALAGEIWLLEKFLSRRDWRWLTPLPFIAFLLSQAHPSAVFLFGVLGAYGLQLVWSDRKDRPLAARASAWVLLCAAAMVLLAALNPYGFQQVLLPFSFAGEERVTLRVIEFLPSMKTIKKWDFLVLLAAGALAVSVNLKKRGIVDGLLFLVFGYLAYRYVRNIALFALVMYVPVCKGFTALSEIAANRWAAEQSSRLTGVRKLAAWTGVTVCVCWFAMHKISHPQWGAGPASGVFPVAAAKAIMEIRPPGRIFNFYDLGGYLDWALEGQYQVFIDGRHYGANRALAVHDAVTRGRSGWQRALDQYDVNTIIIQATRSHQAQLVPLVKILAGDPDWELAVRGEKALLFLKAGAVPDLPGHFRLDKSEVWQQVRAEAKENIAEYPFQAPAYHALGEALLGLGEREGAMEAFAQYLELAPDDEQMARRLRELRDGQ